MNFDKDDRYDIIRAELENIILDQIYSGNLVLRELSDFQVESLIDYLVKKHILKDADFEELGKLVDLKEAVDFARKLSPGGAGR